MKPEVTDFRVDELLQRLDVEFAPLAREKGLNLRFMPCALTVRSDRRLLRRLLQNFVSNAIKYTPAGSVLVGCRRRGGKLRIDVYDTGIGIPHSKRRAVFKEFHRLDHGARVARGVGLGLSIVERIARVLDSEVALKSVVGRGSRFSVEVPRAAAAAASHDILQPLNAARLYVTSLIERQRQTDNEAEDGGLVQNIDASLEAVEEIFAALLDISRLDTGAMKPETTDFRVDELLQRLDVEFAPLAREKGLKLRFMPCALTVRSDRRLLRRLLQNFVSNAIKYTPAGRVLVGCRRDGDKLRIDVYDTGIGIPHSKRRAVFKEFHRLDQGARVARGVGLGLSIVERIARVLDSEVALKSAVGRGSHFSVEVPRAAAAAPAVQPMRLDAGRLTGTVALAIDNERSILDGMEKLLGGWGCRVLTAADLAEALAAIDASGVEPDGLLVDYHLDGGNGVVAIAELRRRLGRHVPAILITADRSLHVREEAQAEAVHLLNKPLKPASLRALITQWRVQRVAAE